MKKLVIYKAIFPNGKVYIGRTSNFTSRIYNHIHNAKNDIKIGKKNMIIMAKAIIKYGFENIKWEIIHECDSIEDMKSLEIFYIKEYNSIDHNFGYNMICGDKIEYVKRENIDPEYKLDIIKRKLKSNGHDPDKYIVIDDNMSIEIKNDYIENFFSIKSLVRKYKVSKNRITRFLKSNNIIIDINRCVITNSKILEDNIIFIIIEKYKNGKLVKEIALEENLTIMIVSRILHDSGIRESKRFKNGKRYDGRQPKRLQVNIQDK